MTEIADLDAFGLAQAYRAKTLSPVEVARDTLARIERFEPEINAFVVREKAVPLAMAKAAEARLMKGEALGPLDGVPVTIKDTPLSQGVWPRFENLTLPAITLGFVYIALIARITRASMLEVLQQDYIRTARSKGVSQPSILFVHALKNAAIPIVTVIGIGIALLIGGAVVTESVFAIPGLGRLTVDAILRRD